MANAGQVSDFRSKLIDSGWFTNVMVEEQTPSTRPQRDGANVGGIKAGGPRKADRRGTAGQEEQTGRTPAAWQTSAARRRNP